MNEESLNTRIEEVLRKQEEINQDIERLNNLIKNKQEEYKTPLGWIPEEEQAYFFIGTRGDICKNRNYGFELDLYIFEHTRVFKTKEEAEFEAERMKVLRELEKFACEFNYELELYRGGYYICYDYHANKLLVNSSTIKCHELYFESEEKAIEAIKVVGEDRVKKYYLGVEDN